MAGGSTDRTWDGRHSWNHLQTPLQVGWNKELFREGEAGVGWLRAFGEGMLCLHLPCLHMDYLRVFFIQVLGSILGTDVLG